MMPKPSPEEILRSIEKGSEDDELESVLSMSDEEVHAELLAAGYTEEKLAKEHSAILGPAPAEPPGVRGTPPEGPKERANVRPLRRRPSWRVWGSITALAASFTAFVSYAEMTGLFESGVTSAPDDRAQAERLRSQAREAMDAGEWGRGLELLDRAKAKDPKGDESAEVQAERRAAKEKLAAGDG
jgi:hypothetical protein